MCEYCNNNKSFGNKKIIKNDDVDVFIVDDILYTLIVEKYIGYQEYINYCPMCGDKINKDLK